MLRIYKFKNGTYSLDKLPVIDSALDCHTTLSHDGLVACVDNCLNSFQEREVGLKCYHLDEDLEDELRTRVEEHNKSIGFRK